MKKFGEKSIRFLLSSVLVLNMFIGLSTSKVKGVSFDGGSGTVEDPYIISTAEQLDAVRDNHSASYKLANDIDLTDYIDQKYGSEGWRVIGGDPDPYSFDGNFDGNGYKISGLWINRPSEDYVAFFGGFKGDNTEIKNLNIEISPKGIIGKNYVGGMVGNNEGRLISGCSVTGGSVLGTSSVGKFVGANYKVISNCYVAGEKVSYSHASWDGDIGGFAGKCDTANSITEDCLSLCDVNTINEMDAGGFVGMVYGNSTIRRCYSSGNVNNTKLRNADSHTGGFVGRCVAGTISNCYTSGNVKGTHKYISGFLGELNVKLENSYACCKEIGFDTKEFLGIINANSSALKCYYDKSKGIQKDIEYKAADESKFTSEIYGKTTEEMYKKATYEGWDFDTIWDIKEGESYPYLRSSLPMYYSFSPRSAVYTGSGQNVEITKNECGRSAGAGNPTAVMYSGAATKPVNVGKYDISVNLGAGSATNPATGVKLLGSYTIEKATLSLDHFNYDLSAASYEEGVKRPAILSAKPGTAFTNEINDLIRNGKIWLEYKTEGENWSKEAPVNAATYEVKIVVGEEATNFKPAEFAI